MAELINGYTWVIAREEHQTKWWAVNALGTSDIRGSWRGRGLRRTMTCEDAKQ